MILFLSVDNVAQARVVEGNLLSSIHFSTMAIVTVSRAGLVKLWQRPVKTNATSHRQRDRPMREGRERDLRSPREREGAVMA